MRKTINDILYLPSGEQFSVGIDVPMRFTLRELRKLDNSTILFISKGKIKVEVDFREFTINEGNTLGLVNGQFLMCKEACENLTISYITFSRELIQEMITPFPLSFLAFLMEYPVSSEMTERDIKRVRVILLVAQYIYLERRYTFRVTMFKNILQTCLMDLYDKTKSHFLNRQQQNPSRQEGLLERFIYLIFQHGRNQREVKFYANQLCISTRYLSSVVQTLTGYTPKELIDERCVQEIKMLLHTTSHTMQEIAIELNFPDQSFFTRYFKKHTGMTPAEYRKNKK